MKKLSLGREPTQTDERRTRPCRLNRTRHDIVMMRTPDGHSRLELSKFQTSAAISTDPNIPVNTLGNPAGTMVALAEKLGNP